MKSVLATQLRQLLHEANTAIALFDIREAGEIHGGHIPGATALPRRMIELRIHELVMARATPIVVYDEGGGRAELAAQTLGRLGYCNVSVLQGGTAAWKSAGGELVEGRNVPSKVFAEKMFKDQEVPQITADNLQQWIAGNTPHVIFDIRAPEEHRIGHVPNAHNVAGVEVTLIAQDLEQKKIPVVVHCAGRTRSILACQTLRDLGLKDVYALKNGTMGWTLAGFELARETGPKYAAASAAGRAEGARRSKKLAVEHGVEYVDAAQLTEWLKQSAAGEINCYAFDVRQADNYAAGHIAGTRSLPGGQAVLFADDNAAVRNASIVFIDEEEAQASMTAYWFKRLGYPKVFVLAGGIPAWQKHTNQALESGKTRASPMLFKEARETTRQITAADLSALMTAEPALRILDVNTSKNFAAGHIRNARWVSRGWLEPRADELLPDHAQPVAVVCQNGVQSAYAGATLHALGYKSVYVLAAGLASWKKAGLPLETGAPASAAGSADVVKSPYERTKEDMVKYLHWEEQLADKPGKEPAKSKP